VENNAKSAKAEAQAAKARAKAMRPWYAKKRLWLAAAVIVVIAVAIASSGGGKNEASGDSSAGSDNGISAGLGSQDASGDVTNLDCGAPDAIGITYPKVTVTNNSSKASDYVITLVAESADGATKYDETPVFITNLQPGQTMTEEGMFTSELPSGAVCKVTEVQRTAS
jgi:hypothetical protein